MQHAFLTVDLGFGDAGKGTVVDFLTRAHAAHTVIRYNGGAQAGHRVVTPGPAGQAHIFAQFGSGTLAGAATHLSQFMLLDPLAMEQEAAHLESLGGHDPFGWTTIDASALVITPFQRAANRLQELARGAQRHGSCGMGVGETQADALAHGARVLRAGDLGNPAVLGAKLQFLRAANWAKVQPHLAQLAALPAAAAELDVLEAEDWLEWTCDAYGQFAARAQIVPGDYLHAILHRPGTVIFEGAQGVLLDEAYGFHPHTTWSNITLENALCLLAEARYAGQVTRLGITRAYATRHGAGPFVTEEPGLTALLPDPANEFGAWQAGFRVGWLDLVMLKYALAAVGGVDALAVTCLDRLGDLAELKVCRRYRCGREELEQIPLPAQPGDLEQQAAITALLLRCTPVLETAADEASLLKLLAIECATPVGLVSMGPTATDKVQLPQAAVELPGARYGYSNSYAPLPTASITLSPAWVAEKMLEPV